MSAQGSSAAAWDSLASTYEAQRVSDAVYVACVSLACIATVAAEPRTVLDVGCGTGLATLQLGGAGRTVFAVDYSLASLRQLRAKPDAPPVVLADACALPIRSRAVEAVLCANVLQHLTPSQQRSAVRELRRVLAPGGRLVITVHHYSRAKRRAGWIKEGKPGQPGIDYIFRCTRRDLKRLVPDARVTALGFSGILGRLERCLPIWCRGFLARSGGGHMLMAIARIN